MADPGFGRALSVVQKGRSPCSKHEVASGGGGGAARGVSPFPRWNNAVLEQI